MIYQTGQASQLNTWFEVWIPNMTNAFFVVAQPPLKLPMPEVGQNELMTIELTLTISDYKGMDLLGSNDISGYGKRTTRFYQCHTVRLQQDRRRGSIAV